MSEIDVAAAEALVVEAKQPGKFDLGSALKKASYPTDDVSIYLDGQKAHEYNVLVDEISELNFKAVTYSAANTGGMTDAPEKEAIDEEIAELEEQQKAILAEIAKSTLTFRMRGCAPEQWRLIIKKWQREGKKNFKDSDATEAEISEWVNERIDQEIIAKTIVKITDAEGNEDDGAVKLETVADLHGAIFQSEWTKLLNASNTLTFANNLFDQVIAQDADFLSKYLAGQTNDGTSS